jgi:hypothetical protein
MGAMPLSFPPVPPPRAHHDIIIVNTKLFGFVGKRRQALRMSKGMQPYGSRQSLKTTRVNYREADKEHARKYVYWGFSGRKEAVKASKQGNEADRVRPTTVCTQLTAAFRDWDCKRQVGTKGCDWLQAAEKPGAQGRSERGEDFGLNVAYGLLGGTDLVLSRSCELSPA